MSKLSDHAKRLREMDSQSVRVGWFPENEYPDGAKVAAIMAQNEFGGAIQVPARQQVINRTIGADGEFKNGGRFVKGKNANFQSIHEVPAHTVVIPARPLMRTAAEAAQPVLAEAIPKDAAAVLNGRITASQAIARIGERVVKSISQILHTNNFQRNAPSTIRQKGFDKPLVDSGHAGQSVTYKVGGGE